MYIPQKLLLLWVLHHKLLWTSFFPLQNDPGILLRLGIFRVGCCDLNFIFWKDVTKKVLMHKTNTLPVSYTHRKRSSLTGLVTEIQNIVIGTCQFPHDLPVVLTLGQPSVAGEAEGLIQQVVLHIHILQMPPRSRTWSQWRTVKKQYCQNLLFCSVSAIIAPLINTMVFRSWMIQQFWTKSLSMIQQANHKDSC